MDHKRQDDIFDEISRYWSAEINNEIYFKEKELPYERGSKEYFDYIIQHHEKYVYYFDRVIQYFTQDISSQKQSKLLDIGCGMGIDLLKLAQLGYQCYGIDLADKHVELAKQVFQIYNRQAVIQKGNAEKLDFPDESFDCIYSNGVIHHTLTPQNAINEVYRVMEPGGKGFIMLYAKYSMNNLAHILSRKPFENPRGDNPVARDAHFVYRYSKSEIRKMFKNFSSVNLEKEYLFGAGWGKIYDLIPKRIYRLLSKILGWHLLIFFEK